MIYYKEYGRRSIHNLILRYDTHNTSKILEIHRMIFFFILIFINDIINVINIKSILPTDVHCWVPFERWVQITIFHAKAHHVLYYTA